MVRIIGWMLLLICGCVLPMSVQAQAIRQADLFSFSVGYMDFDKTESHRESADFRFEYRWGTSLLPMLQPSWQRWDHSVQVHPIFATETTSRGALYGMGGLGMDLYMGPHGIFTWSEGVGLFYPGAMQPMGSVIEFRSQAEVGWRFTDQTRLTLQASHISNAHITGRNPGAEIAGIYLHVPLDTPHRY
ncbi:MAG: acyloxyacyl hydrolase [Alphaproteobacteria bacterium]|nr:acyloxyacyl hydrolase [Alphaproteobacteria bacterium]MBV8548955.1 acyloxyacyl hydrolase [Alphaproteobacteria bacterium]